MRYSKSAGAKIYRAGASNVVVDPEAGVEDLPPGEEQDSGSRSAKKSSSRGSGFGKAGQRSAHQKAMAAQAARELIEGLDEAVIRCFTDGGCRGNPGPAGSGAVVYLGGGRRGEASASLGQGTNNIGELCAVGLALDLLEHAEVDPASQVAVFTDSAYTNGVLCMGWKAKANREIILTLRERLERWSGLRIYWVAGHVGVAGNERADALATAGIDGITNTTWYD